MKQLSVKQFFIITLITSIWINASEVFRYFVFVKPRVQAFFDHQPGIAEMDIGIFAIWGVWDTLLTAVLVMTFWMVAQTFGNNGRSVFTGGTLVWATVFVIFWVATANMGLCNWSILLITLPLSWIEMIVGAWIAGRCFQRMSP